MRQMKKVAILIALGALTASTQAAVIFSDNFESGLGNWDITNNSNSSISIVTRDGDDDCIEIQGVDSWCAANTVDSFTTPGAYRLEFDAWQNIQNNNDGRVRVALPGGLNIGFMAWNNGFVAWYKDVAIDGGGWTSADTWGTWNSYAIEIDGISAEFYKNGVLQKSWTLDSDPDFSAYSKVSLVGIADAPGAKGMFDNVSLSYTPEPTLLSVLGFGAMGFLRRRK